MNNHDHDPYLMTRAALEKLVEEQERAIQELVDEAADRSEIISKLRLRIQKLEDLLEDRRRS